MPAAFGVFSFVVHGPAPSGRQDRRELWFTACAADYQLLRRLWTTSA